MRLSIVFLLLLTIAVSGCSKKNQTSQNTATGSGAAAVSNTENGKMQDMGYSKDDMVTCPVNGTKMKVSEAYAKVEYKGTMYYFCCASCKPQFMRNPEKYIKPAGSDKR